MENRFYILLSGNGRKLELQPSANNQIYIYNLTAANIDKLWYVFSIYMLEEIENIDIFTVINFGKSCCPDTLGY